MKAKWFVAVLLLPVLFLTGCATIVGKDVFPVTINSNPDGANIVIVDESGKKMFSGTTPTTISLAAGQSYFHAKTYSITFSKPGYTEQYATVKATLSGWYFGNILFGGRTTPSKIKVIAPAAGLKTHLTIPAVIVSLNLDNAAS